MSTTELLDLLRRLPPHRIESNLSTLVEVLGGPSNETADELLSSVDQPLKVLRDEKGREFLACDFNRDSLLGEEDDDDDNANAAGSGDAYRWVHITCTLRTRQLKVMLTH